MISDGFLDKIKDLVIVCTCPIPQDTAKKITEREKNGGRVWYRSDSAPWILESGQLFSEFTGMIVKEKTGTDAGIYCTEKWNEFEPYASIRKNYTEDEVYVTLHGDKYSVYIPEKKKIEIKDI